MSGKVYSIKSRSGPLLWLMPEPLYLKDGQAIAVSKEYIDVFDRQHKSAVEFLSRCDDDIITGKWVIMAPPFTTELETGSSDSSDDIESADDIQSLASNKSMHDKKKKRKGKK